MVTDRRRWSDEAREDLQTALVLLDAARYSASAFHSQQAAEKALKAVLYGMNKCPWGHTLISLLNEVVDNTTVDTPDTLRSSAVTLDPHYVNARYPDAHLSGTAAAHYDAATALEAYQCASRILEACEAL